MFRAGYENLEEEFSEKILMERFTPIAPVIIKGAIPACVCPNCSTLLLTPSWKHCVECGQKIKW